MKSLYNNRGVSVVLLALSIIMLFGFGALAIDIAHLYNVKDQLQNAADAAALAGAGELTGATEADKESNAKAAAVRVAARNVADVAYKAGIPTAQPGEAIPVTLDPSTDIEVGIWDSKTGFTANTPPYNAVKVVAKRTGERADQPEAQNWFAKIFKLLGANYDLSRINATAIAERSNAPILPIAVNEYWLESDSPGNRPYGSVHDYPNAFVRMNRVKVSIGDATVPSEAFGYTFAIMGSAAASNVSGPQNPNSYIDLDYRSPYHIGAAPPPPSNNYCWFHSQDNASGCSLCNNSFTSGLCAAPNAGTVESDRTGSNFEYFFGSGYPENRVLPTAVYEVGRSCVTASAETGARFASIGGRGGKSTLDKVKGFFTSLFGVSNAYADKPIEPPGQEKKPPPPPPPPPPPGCYPGFDNYLPSNGNEPSNCPYATVAYFSEGGNPVLSQQNVDKLTIPKVIHKGDRIICGVYDGSYVPAPPSQPNTLTLVGYVAIEVDGYESQNPKNIGLQAGNNKGAWDHNKSVLKSDDNTMYGHAISNIMQPDPPMAWGGSGTNGGYCGFLDAIRALSEQYPTIRLVGTGTAGVRYGVAD